MQNNEGGTAISIATNNGRIKILELLCEAAKLDNNDKKKYMQKAREKTAEVFYNRYY